MWQDIWLMFSGLEGLAMVLALAYVILAVREKISCWYAAFASSAIYTVVFWDVSLLMDSALNIYYVVMAVVGWYQWRGGDVANERTITAWPWFRHLKAMVAIAFVSLVSGFLLAENSTAAWPYLDSFTTWASVFTTWLLARKVLENWLYWIVIDAVSIFLYIDRGLYATVVLFVLYTLMASVGYLQWRRSFRGRLTNNTGATYQAQN